MTPMATIRILLVDDHAIVREGYRALLAKQPGLQVVAEAEDGVQGYQRFKECSPDVVITDLSLPGISGLELISRIKQRAAGAKILVFEHASESRLCCAGQPRRRFGICHQKQSPGGVAACDSRGLCGRHILSADIAQALALEKLGSERMALETLTVREFEILRLLVEAPVNRGYCPNPQYQPENSRQLPLPDQTQTRCCQRHRTNAVGDQAECG